MLWAIALVLIVLWILGLGAGFTMGSFIHILYVAAVVLLVVSLSQEVMTNQKLRHESSNCGPKPDSKRKHKRLSNQPMPSRNMP
jgi:hypothetical protein